MTFPDEHDWHAAEPITRSPRAMLVIAVMVVGTAIAVGVGLWLAFN